MGDPADNSWLDKSDIADLRDSIRAAGITLTRIEKVARDQLFVQREQLRIQQAQLDATNKLLGALTMKLGNGHDIIEAPPLEEPERDPDIP